MAHISDTHPDDGPILSLGEAAVPPLFKTLHLCLSWDVYPFVIIKGFTQSEIVGITGDLLSEMPGTSFKLIQYWQGSYYNQNSPFDDTLTDNIHLH